MKQDVRKIIEDTERLCREAWELRNRAMRAVEDSRALSDQIQETIHHRRQQILRSKKRARSSSIL